ncbi:MAG: 5-formyltetrahydrofolate cyclo-ligase, partial [Flavobacteriales bacterium]
QIPEEKIDMVILPLVVSDKKGNRVGYGKGFYDKFLHDCKKDITKVGLSFYEPVQQIDDIEEHDEPLDICITPENVYFMSQDQ